jgi:hypothetical protein
MTDAAVSNSSERSKACYILASVGCTNYLFLRCSSVALPLAPCVAMSSHVKSSISRVGPAGLYVLTMSEVVVATEAVPTYYSATVFRQVRRHAVQVQPTFAFLRRLPCPSDR